MNDYRAEIVAALRAEAWRIEAGGDADTVLAHTYGNGWQTGHHIDLGKNHGLIGSFKDEAFSDNMWKDHIARMAHWGVYIPIAGARVVSIEQSCVRCDGDDIYYLCDYGVVTLLDYVEPVTIERVERCDDCEYLEDEDE